MKPKWLVTAKVDESLMKRTGLAQFALLRLRKEFHRRYANTPPRPLSEGGTSPRFRFMHAAMVDVLCDEDVGKWLKFIDYSTQYVEEMSRGTYPISPYVIRVYSALFGVRVDFLLLGAPPVADEVGACIDVWPMHSSAR